MNLDLLTPCLLLDKARFEKNLRRIKQIADSRRINFRPHLKTAKSADIAKMCAQYYGERAMVSTIMEIEQLKNCGLTDFLYSVAIVPDKFNYLASLIDQDCNVTVAIDSIVVAHRLAKFCRNTGHKIPAVIELDLDGHRSGVKPSDKNKLCEMASILDSQNLFRGVMSHAGESYNLSDKTALSACAQDEIEQTNMAANTLLENNLPCELVTVGSTPTTLMGQHCSGITEFRAGVFMMFDLTQVGIGVCSMDDIALSVLTTVISKNPDRGTIIVDAGWMALSQDRGTASQAVDYGYGQVCRLDGTPIQDLKVVDVQQEHGIIQLPGGRSDELDFEIGQQLRILPNHACATAAQHKKYIVLAEHNNVETEWPRFSGW